MSSRRKRKDVKFLTVKDGPVHGFHKRMTADASSSGVGVSLPTFKRVVHGFISNATFYTICQKLCPLWLRKRWIKMLDVNTKM